MRDYGKISTSIWNSRKFRSLKDDDARLAYFYFLTCQRISARQNPSLVDQQACEDLRWSMAKYTATCQHLADVGLIELSDKGSPIYVFDHRDPATLIREIIRRKRASIPARVRLEVRLRAGSLCAYCGTADGPFEIDHIHPWSKAGSDAPDNLTLACVSCNRSKGATDPLEWAGRRQL